jgi:A/G-specific adenine glycosylase
LNLDLASIRRRLARWYEKNQRDLPWRRTRDPYAIWISEIMLQQTRVAAVIPYYERFLARFPNPESLAGAGEPEVLKYWSGLGYYSRARNLRRAAQQIAHAGVFPQGYDAIRALPGIGAYTAAAVASIAYSLPYAAVDGNVRRVAMRIAGDASADVQSIADGLLDGKNPGRSNQALMELGAMICVPRNPLCKRCPIAQECQAHRQGTQTELPPARIKPTTVRLDRTLLIIRDGDKILLAPSLRVHGFWDVPDWFDSAKVGERLGVFRHAILNRQYRFDVRAASVTRRPRRMKWVQCEAIHEFPLSTTAKKALRCLTELGER